MNVVKPILASLIFCSWMVAAAEPSDADRMKAYEDRIKTLEQHVKDLEKKLDDQTSQNRADATRPGMMRRAPFSRDRFDDLMNQMRRQMENEGAFGFPQPNMGQPFQLPPRGGMPGMNRMRLGVALEEVSPLTAKEFNNNDVKEGAFVRSVVPGSPAEKAGIQVGDTITSFDEKSVRTPQDIIAAVKSATKGKHPLIVNRHGQALSLSVELGAEVAAVDEDQFPNFALNFDDLGLNGLGGLGGNGNLKTQTQIKASALELNSDLAKEMKLTDAQTKQVNDVLAKHSKALSDEFTAASGNGHADMAPLAQKHADAAAKDLAGVLNADQLKQWNDYRATHNSISFSQTKIFEGGAPADVGSNGKTESF